MVVICLALKFRFMRDGEFDERERAAQIEFARNVGAVSFDRAVADKKFFADLLAGFVFGNKLENAFFGRRKLMQSGLFSFEFFGAATAI